MLQMVFHEAIKIRDSLGLIPGATLSGQWPSLELLASLLCILDFQPKQATTTGARISVTASGDNKLSSTKYSMYLVLMELSEQMRLRNMIFSIAWRPRDENEEADALTNEVFYKF